MDEAELKDRLRRGEVPARPAEFLDEHLDALGSLDPELRDELFYEAADRWIGEGRLPAEELSRLAARLLSPGFLFRSLGEPCGPDVFRRTFTCLVLDSIVQRAETGEACRIAIAEAMERYVAGERDLRGYLPTFGWAHAPAHAADVLASLAKVLPEPWPDRLLAMTRTLLLKSDVVYTHQEDRRLSQVPRRLADRRDLAPWLEALEDACPVSFRDMAAYARRTNLLDFLRALCFQLRVDPGREALAASVEAQVRRLMRLG